MFSEFDLEKNVDELSVEKIALLQMLQDGGKINFGELMCLKMMSDFLKEDKDGEKKELKTE